ncbi:MAG: DeoR/GlpR transcriptional regulator [Rhodobacteraceae bacterium]|uniref:Transcriptional regulator, DeoR family n=1 Tax=Salipiger profundus TaxID=1229727 RepID=A0A1U7D645_9RHOB|nr:MULTISPECIES: DeoR/GlpR family DNA-binding transcription regulator [Salipiger]APX23593.1 transcriptional regulator, DeoR family [Salipiger profundus]MAB09025.1 DeoR/GlpR transcriptional regulator [Paracoccaceae bacterium]GGA28262.1 DeoR family transcriptional regulator [Salipiger profundus]SFC77262.1 transcriptional regulator, DeoR family [Salipiger profundus]
MRLDLHGRRDAIIALLAENVSLSAADLSERLGVSVQTLRADLRDLDEAALVQRRNGRAQLRQQSENIGYLPREGIARKEKQRIALAVKNLIPDGARVALGTGTTVEQCARFLTSHGDLFVVSNSIHAVCALQNAPGIAVELAGGTVRMRDLDMIGVAAHQFFSTYRVDYSVFSCGGVSDLGGVMDYNSDEIAVRKAIAGCGKQSVLVVDSTKMGADLACQMGHIRDFDVVVTGARLAPALLRDCKQADCRVIEV